MQTNYRSIIVLLSTLIAACSGASENSGTGGESGASPCPQGRGPTMVSVGDFCIDSTEVTAEQYSKFIASSPDVTAQLEVCSWNHTFSPDNGGYCDFGSYDPSGHPSRPVICVDWCDAYAYCKWAGKRLCGKLGGGLGSPDGAGNEWAIACTSRGMLSYPYGNQYVSENCFGDDLSNCIAGDGICLPRDVGAFPLCTAPAPPFDRIFDLSGNVAEWEDSCQGVTGLHDTCRPRGGNLGDEAVSLQCLPPEPAMTRIPRSGVGQGLGIRCCADLR